MLWEKFIDFCCCCYHCDKLVGFFLFLSKLYIWCQFVIPFDWVMMIKQIDRMKFSLEPLIWLVFMVCALQQTNDYHDLMALSLRLSFCDFSFFEKIQHILNNCFRLFCLSFSFFIFIFEKTMDINICLMYENINKHWKKKNLIQSIIIIIIAMYDNRLLIMIIIDRHCFFFKFCFVLVMMTKQVFVVSLSFILVR